MKKTTLYIFLVIFFCTNAFTESRDRNTELDELFNQLKKSKNASIAFEIEAKIWNIWSTHPTQKKLTDSLEIGSNLMSWGELESAYQIFSRIIDSAPEWSEGWNRRATVLYLMGKYTDSLSDIDEVLKRENRHFGALSGQALIQIGLKNYEQAINSYKTAQSIYPFIRAADIMIPQLQELINNEAI